MLNNDFSRRANQQELSNYLQDKKTIGTDQSESLIQSMDNRVYEVEESLIVLPDIPGLEVIESVERVGGSKQFYLEVLHLFLARQAGKNIVMREALSASCWQQLTEFVHDVKGVLGILGALPLYSSALHLETLIKDNKNKDILQDKVEGFLCELDDFLELLRSKLLEQMTT